MVRALVVSCLILGLSSPITAFLHHANNPFHSRNVQARSSQGRTFMKADFALLFDCDGVLADTERDGHRPSFNLAFEKKGIKGTVWDVDLYGKLLRIGGGKERMTAHWNEVGWPSSIPEAERSKTVKDLHLLKTDLFMDLIERGEIPLRPGVLRVVDEAIKAGVPLGVCSTSNDKAVTNLVRVLMGPERASKFQIFAGDVVAKKKPAPDIYNLAKDKMGLDPKRTVVIEDSEIGLKAAKAAGMKCIVTMSSYTKNEDFKGADMVVPQLGDKVTLEDIRKLAMS